MTADPACKLRYVLDGGQHMGAVRTQSHPLAYFFSVSDGRLTSSWNWTSRIAKKSYYHSFMLSGFQGFDGDFR
jgi:hypothetical protein